MISDAQRELAQALSAPFAPEDYRSFEGRGGRVFTYVDDEAVMQRLDDVFGVDGVDISQEAHADGVVKVTIIAGGCKKEDFGYPTNGQDGEPLKEAVSDGIRRVGRMFGIARDVYEGKVAPGGAAQQRSPQAARSQPQQAARPAAPTPVAPADTAVIRQEAERIFNEPLPTTCPKHAGAKLYGGEKGAPDLYHKTDERTAEGKTVYCRPFAVPRAPRR